MTAVSTRRRAARPGLAVAGCAALVGLVSAGCSGDDGSSTAGAQLPSPSTPSASSAAAGEPSPVGGRPENLTLEGVDPCSLFTDAQLDELEVNSNPRSRDKGRDGPTCSLDVDLRQPYYGYAVENVPADLAEWLSGSRHKDVKTTERTKVEGFPALLSYAEAAQPLDCEALVSVADGETLRVQSAPISMGAFEQPQLCDMAKRAATLAIQTLESTR